MLRTLDLSVRIREAFNYESVAGHSLRRSPLARSHWLAHHRRVTLGSQSAYPAVFRVVDSLLWKPIAMLNLESLVMVRRVCRKPQPVE